MRSHNQPKCLFNSVIFFITLAYLAPVSAAVNKLSCQQAFRISTNSAVYPFEYAVILFDRDEYQCYYQSEDKRYTLCGQRFKLTDYNKVSLIQMLTKAKSKWRRLEKDIFECKRPSARQCELSLSSKAKVKPLDKEPVFID